MGHYMAVTIKGQPESAAFRQPESAAFRHTCVVISLTGLPLLQASYVISLRLMFCYHRWSVRWTPVPSRKGGKMLTGGTRKAETKPLLKKADSQEITLVELLEVCLQNICLAPKSLGLFRGWKLNRGLWLHKILVRSLTVSTQKGNNILLPKRGWNKRSLFYVWHSPFHFIKKP